MNIRHIAIAAALAYCTLPAKAGSVTYDFIEGGTSKVGAVLTFASPPASPDAPWSTSNSGDVPSFAVTAPFLLGARSYPATIVTTVSSLTGARLDAGEIRGSVGAFTADTTIAPTPGTSLFEVTFVGVKVGLGVFVEGDWVLASVPEPPSLILSGVVALAGLGAWGGARPAGVVACSAAPDGPGMDRGRRPRPIPESTLERIERIPGKPPRWSPAAAESLVQDFGTPKDRRLRGQFRAIADDVRFGAIDPGPVLDAYGQATRPGIKTRVAIFWAAYKGLIGQ